MFVHSICSHCFAVCGYHIIFYTWSHLRVDVYGLCQVKTVLNSNDHSNYGFQFRPVVLTHLPVVLHLCVTESGQQWFR